MPKRRNRQHAHVGPYASTRISERQSQEKKVHVQSSQYDVFSTGAVDLSTLGTRTETYAPLRVGNNPTTWLVGEFDPGWAQLMSTYITFFVSVTEADGTELVDGNGFLMNNAAHTLIRSIKMTIKRHGGLFRARHLLDYVLPENGLESHTFPEGIVLDVARMERRRVRRVRQPRPDSWRRAQHRSGRDAQRARRCKTVSRLCTDVGRVQYRPPATPGHEDADRSVLQHPPTSDDGHRCR